MGRHSRSISKNRFFMRINKKSKIMAEDKVMNSWVKRSKLWEDIVRERKRTGANRNKNKNSSKRKGEMIFFKNWFNTKIFALECKALALPSGQSKD